MFKHLIPAAILALGLGSCTPISHLSQSMKNATNLVYPSTEKSEQKDIYFGTEVKDPYRWLEDDRSAQTNKWVKDQNILTAEYLSRIPFRDFLRTQLRELWNYEKISAPFVEGGMTYYYKNNGLQAQSVLYRRNAYGVDEIFLDPNKFSEDGTTSLAGISFSPSGNRIAYSISEGGSDWNKIIIEDVRTRRKIDETLVDVKFSGMAWDGEQGFYYSRYEKPEGSSLSAKTDMHKVYYHRLGTLQSEDTLILGGEDFKRRYITASVSEDQRWLIVSAANSTSGNELYVRDLRKPGSAFVPIVTGYTSSQSVVTTQGDNLYILTDRDAPNMRLVKVNMSSQTNIWEDVIPESENVLQVSSAGGYLFATTMVDAIDKVRQYDMNGRLLKEIQLPGQGNVTGFSGKEKDKEVYFSFTNYTTPSSIYRYDLATQSSSLYQRPKVKFNPDDYTSEQVFFTSKDGTRIPMIISYKKGLKRDGKNPTILYSYGGFNISLQPSFSVVNAVWMDQGGIYAVPNIRGGGEYGKKWHDAGTKQQKKNVFEDFIAAGEFLQKNGYTSPEYMALSGRSNGGLLVGATMTMRPDLARVAFPGVGVLDMLRYHTFTAGAGWAYDYGTAQDSPEMFRYLQSYSPVHNVRQGVVYPSTMIITSDHDDRVVPAHSFKFGAELQAKGAPMNPYLIRIETNAGHGAGRSTEQVIGENADLLSFALYEMGIRDLPKR